MKTSNLSAPRLRSERKHKDSHVQTAQAPARRLRLRLDGYLDQARLGPRATDALHRLGVRTVGQFLAVDVSRILELYGCGQVAYRRAKSAQTRIRDKFSKGTTTSTKRELDLAWRVIDLIGMISLREVLDIHKRDALRVSGHGIQAWRGVIALQQLIAQSLKGRKTRKAVPLNFGNPVSLSMLELLPVFSSDSTSRPSAIVLHKSYRGEIPVTELLLLPRVERMLSELGIDTLGALLLTPARVLTNQKNLGEVTLAKVQDTIRDFLLHTATSADASALDFSSSSGLVRSFVRRAFDDQRTAGILLSRFGLGRSDILTYKEVGKEYGITRARVGQIVQVGPRVLSSQVKLRLLAPLWAEVDKIIGKNGGLIEVSTLAQKLSHRFDWKSCPRIHTLANILLLNRELHVYENAESVTSADFLRRQIEADLVCREGFPCVTCGQGPINLSRAFKSGPEEMGIKEAGRRIAAICSKYCPRGAEPPSRFPSVLVVHFALRTDNVIVQGDRVHTKRHWLLCRSESLKEVIAATLEVVGYPVHYSELASRIRSESTRFKNVPDRSIHTCLMYYGRFQLAGRGAYGLASWKIRPYKSRTQAIIELLEKHGKPMSASQVISRLTRGGALKPQNLRAALCEHPRFVEVEEGVYDLRERVKQDTRRKS